MRQSEASKHNFRIVFAAFIGAGTVFKNIFNIQLIELLRYLFLFLGRESKAGHELVFKADNLPPMGFKSYHISKGQASILVEGENLEPFSRRKKTILGKDSKR